MNRRRLLSIELRDFTGIVSAKDGVKPRVCCSVDFDFDMDDIAKGSALIEERYIGPALQQFRLHLMHQLERDLDLLAQMARKEGE